MKHQVVSTAGERMHLNPPESCWCKGDGEGNHRCTCWFLSDGRPRMTSYTELAWLLV